MAGLRDFLSGILAGLLHIFIGTYVISFIPSFPFSIYIIQPLMFGFWVVVATFILEKIGH